MKESLSEKIFGESGEISNRRIIGLAFKGFTLSFRYPLNLDRQMIESLRIRDELLQLANKEEISQFQNKLKSTKPSQ